MFIWCGGNWQPGRHVPDLNRFLLKQVAFIGVQMRTLTDGMRDTSIPPAASVLNDAACALCNLSD